MIKYSEREFGCSSSYIAIEWDPTTLHLRYQMSQEKVSTEHESVERSRKLQTEPIDLYECFRAFTKEEELGEDELWYDFAVKYFCCCSRERSFFQIDHVYKSGRTKVVFKGRIHGYAQCETPYNQTTILCFLNN